MQNESGESTSEPEDVQAEAPAKPEGPLKTSGGLQEERLHDPTAGETAVDGVRTEDADSEATEAEDNGEEDTEQ